MRDALVSWNHATDYDLPAYSTYAGGKGKGLFEKTYDLGVLPCILLGGFEVMHGPPARLQISMCEMRMHANVSSMQVW